MPLMHRLAAIAVLVATCLRADPAAAQAATPVRVDAVRAEMLSSFADVTGSLRAPSRARVASQEEGRVVEVLVDVGERVEAGRVLARLDDRRSRAELAQAEADKLVAEAALLQRRAEQRLAEVELDRVRRAFDQGAANQSEVDTRETQVEVARALVAAAERQIEAVQARVDLLGVRLSDLTIEAPFAGAVVERLTDPGEWLDRGSPVAVVVSTEHLEAWLEVPERHAAAVREHGTGVEVRLVAGSTPLKTLRTRVIEEVDPRSRMFRCVVDVDHGEAGAVAGMSVRGFVPTGGESERLTIARDALLRDGTSFYVYVARPTRPTPSQDGQEQHLATPVPVRVAFETPDRIVIEGPGIAAGDLVVVEGNERLRAGVAVSPIAGDAHADLDAERPGPSAAADRISQEGGAS